MQGDSPSLTKLKKNAGNCDEKGHLISWKFNKSSLADGVWKTKGLLSRDGQGG